MEDKKINLETLADGAFAERTKEAIQKVMENIADPNTEWKIKRKVTVDITFTAAEDREIIECDAVAKPKLAPKKGIHTKFLLDKTLNGEIVAAEYKKQIAGQQTMKVDPDTGEILSDDKADTKQQKKLQVVR